MDVAGRRTRMHPLIVGAAVSFSIVGLVGVGAMLGLIPDAISHKRISAVPSTDKRAARDEAARVGQLSVSCRGCGIVESIRTIEVKSDATVLEPVTVATVGNAAGGPYVGEAERNVKKRLVYRVTVRMDDGSFRTFSQSAPPSVAKGDKVRVVDGTVVARS